MKMFKVKDSDGKIIYYYEKEFIIMLNKQFDFMRFEVIENYGS